MKYIFLSILYLILFTTKTFSQVRSGVSVGYGWNKPFSSDYNSGWGVNTNANIAIGNKWSINPVFGYDRLNSKLRTVYDQYGFAVKRISSIGMVYTGVSGKYYFTDQWFARAGATLFAAGGNEDLSGLGIGGTTAAGYNLNLDSHSTLEFSLTADVVNIEYSGNGVTPIAGLKVAYVFNFKGID